MKIAIHGSNAAKFQPEIETYLPVAHEISVLSDELSDAGEAHVFLDAEVIIDTWYVYPKDQNDYAGPRNLPFHELDNAVLLLIGPAGPGEPSGVASR